MIPGPFVVTHYEHVQKMDADAPVRVDVYREAFATLGDRDRAICVRLLNSVPIGAQPDLYRQVSALGEPGGSIRLPNGDVIEVEATTWSDLVLPSRNAISALFVVAEARKGDADCQRSILAAWNAEHGIGIEGGRDGVPAS